MRSTWNMCCAKGCSQARDIAAPGKFEAELFPDTPTGGPYRALYAEHFVSNFPGAASTYPWLLFMVEARIDLAYSGPMLTTYETLLWSTGGPMRGQEG